MLKIGVVGNGFVGRATARCWMEYADVRVYDKLIQRCTHTLNEVLDCDFAFVCLPTPDDCSTEIIDEFFSLTEIRGRSVVFLLKSTVPVGTTKRLATDHEVDVFHVPEFLTARCATTDAQCPARVIVGDPQPVGLRPRKSASDVLSLFERRFLGVPVYYVRSGESEFAKLACNAFFATKVSFFNQLHRGVDAHGLRWDEIRQCILSDGRITHSHTSVPGPDGKFGFGGACLPKDTLALAKMLNSDVLREVLDDNRRMRGE